MSIENEMPFEHRLTERRSIQALVRAIAVFTKRFPGKSLLTIESLVEQGEIAAVAHFGAPESSGKKGHEKFLELLEKTERIMEIEYLLTNSLVAKDDLLKLKSEGEALLKDLYGER